MREFLTSSLGTLFVPRTKYKDAQKVHGYSGHSEAPSPKAGIVDNGIGFFCSPGLQGPSQALRGCGDEAHSGVMNQQSLPLGPKNPVRKIPDPFQGLFGFHDERGTTKVPK